MQVYFLIYWIVIAKFKSLVCWLLQHPEDSVKDLAEVYISRHYVHGPSSHSEKFNDFLSSFPDWTHVTSWTSTYDKFGTANNCWSSSFRDIIFIIHTDNYQFWYSIQIFHFMYTSWITHFKGLIYISWHGFNTYFLCACNNLGKLFQPHGFD